MSPTVNHPEKWLVLTLGAVLASCGSEKSADGGTGSDFPIHPAVALVQKPNGAMVQAGAWRLWSVSQDSLHYDRELPTTDNGGFQLPDTGSWIVEAWGTSNDAGKPEGLHTLPLDEAFDRCLNWIGRNRTAVSPTPAILGACRELESPTVAARGGPQEDPRAVAAFRLPSSSSPSAVVTDSLGKPLPTRAWRLWRATQDTVGPLRMFRFGGYQMSAENGSIELAGLTGTWVAEGWNSAPSDSLFRLPPKESALEDGLLSLCLGSASIVAPRVCTEPLFETSLYGTDPGQLPVPDAVLVFRLPAAP